MDNEKQQGDQAYFMAHPGKTEYVRPPYPGEFGRKTWPSTAKVRVYWINRRMLVKALEGAGGERLATVQETMWSDETAKRAA